MRPTLVAGACALMGGESGLRRWGWYPIDSAALCGVLGLLCVVPAAWLYPRFPVGLCLVACVLRWVTVFLKV